jgi:uncharacterized Zn finger protein
MPLIETPLDIVNVMRLAGRSTYDRGFRYHKQNKVKEYIYDGNKISAKVSGTE